jgi:predicted adenylyl cyclase CyaB
MQEIEVKILKIDVEATLAQLQELGAHYVGEKNLSAILLDTPRRDLSKKNGSLRLRQENDTCYLTYKAFGGKQQFKNLKETEIIVSDFQQAKNLLSAIGYSNVYRSYEKKRFEFTLGNATICIDKYLNALSYIPVFMEVETRTEEDMVLALKTLGIDKSQAKHYSLSDLLRIYKPEPIPQAEMEPYSDY